MKTTKKNTIRGIHPDHESKSIIIDARLFDEAMDTHSAVYEELSKIKTLFPEYSIARKTVNRNPKQEHYKGLNKKYMYDYINKYEPKNTKDQTLLEYDLVWSGIPENDFKELFKSNDYISATLEEKTKMVNHLRDIFKVKNHKGAMCRARVWFFTKYPEVMKLWKTEHTEDDEKASKTQDEGTRELQCA